MAHNPVFLHRINPDPVHPALDKPGICKPGNSKLRESKGQCRKHRSVRNEYFPYLEIDRRQLAEDSHYVHNTKI